MQIQIERQIPAWGRYAGQCKGQQLGDGGTQSPGDDDDDALDKYDHHEDYDYVDDGEVDDDGLDKHDDGANFVKYDDMDDIGDFYDFNYDDDDVTRHSFLPWHRETSGGVTWRRSSALSFSS